MQINNAYRPVYKLVSIPVLMMKTVVNAWEQSAGASIRNNTGV